MLRCVRGLVFAAEGMKKVHQPEGAGKRARVVGPVNSRQAPRGASINFRSTFGFAMRFVCLAEVFLRFQGAKVVGAR